MMPVHLAQMSALEEDEPETWDALKSGAFVVAKSEISFTRLFTDQALEQELMTLKRHGGIVGLSRDDHEAASHYHTSSCSSESVPQWIPQSFQIFCEERTLSTLKRLL